MGSSAAAALRYKDDRCFGTAAHQASPPCQETVYDFTAARGWNTGDIYHEL